MKYLSREYSPLICLFWLGCLLLVLSVGSIAVAEPEQGLYPHYPTDFDGFGRVDRIGKDVIVIDDSLYSLAPGVTYATPGRRMALLSDVETGDLLGFILNSDGEISSLWLLDQGQGR